MFGDSFGSTRQELGVWVMVDFFGVELVVVFFFFFSSRRRHTRFDCDWSSDVCSSDLLEHDRAPAMREELRRRGRDLDHRAVGAQVAGEDRQPAFGRQRHAERADDVVDRKSTRLNSSHSQISYAVFCLKKKKNKLTETT